MLSLDRRLNDLKSLLLLNWIDRSVSQQVWHQQTISTTLKTNAVMATKKIVGIDLLFQLALSYMAQSSSQCIGASISPSGPIKVLSFERARQLWCYPWLSSVSTLTATPSNAMASCWLVKTENGCSCPLSAWFPTLWPPT